MRPVDRASSKAVSTESSSPNLVLFSFILAIFASAALLFAIEPMFTKMVLPRLGGAASVWSIALVFFQTTLLGGYVYAHLLTRIFRPRTAVIIHLVAMLIACSALPVHIVAGWERPSASWEIFWLLSLFAISTGLPFFVLAANGPLLQAWFAGTDHPKAKDPYFLYAASNAGSFLALACYPLVIEPLIALSEQTFLWTIGFYILILLVAACGLLALRSASPSILSNPFTSNEPRPTLRNITSWIYLAAVPSGLLLAVTVHISTDVAAVPLFWAIPLALYLLTFVVAFQTHPVIPHELVVRLFPIAVVVLVAVLTISPFPSTFATIAAHAVVFFIVALLCHGELARRRPSPRDLTAFYMWISAGGMIGGISTALIAPLLFNWVAEYPILIVLAIACLPGLALPSSNYERLLLIGFVIGAALLIYGLSIVGANAIDWVYLAVVSVLLGLTAYFWKRPLTFATIVAVLFLAVRYGFDDGRPNFVVRNFFGILNAAESADGRFRVLWHGSSAQGAQKIRDVNGAPITGRPELISEFFEGAGIAQVVDAVHARASGPVNIAVVGLGTGALTCLAKPDDILTYFELDPDIIRIARNPKLFNFISACGPATPVVQGDARLTLEDIPDVSCDLVFIDAFIGAAIPIHLLTRQAMALYLRKIKPHGMIAMHISNYNLELGPVVAGIARANGAIMRLYNGGDVRVDYYEKKWVPKVAVIGREDSDFGLLAGSRFWPRVEPDPSQRVWTDDYSNIFGAMLRRIQTRKDEGIGK
jgi:hypothetical protein